VAKALHNTREVFRCIDQPQVARALRQREMLRLLRMTRHVDLGRAAVGREKRREHFSLFDATVLAREIDGAVVGPERATDAEKLFRAGVSFVVFEKVAITPL